MKYYLIAGEASGDLHAANLLKELKLLDPDLKCRAWGGDLLQAQGAELVKHYRELAFMGFIEVIANLRTILKNIEFCKSDIIAYKPDVLILVDYPGFNMRIAEFAKHSGIKVVYYISPQVWAWKQSRVHALKKNVDRMLVILPFEKEFYARFNFNVDFTGHPLLDAISNRKQYDRDEWRKSHGLDQREIIALLPGSRRQEISTMLPVMLSVVRHFPAFQFVVAGAPSLDAQFYHTVAATANITILSGQTYELLENSHAALVTSGTATLETALFNVPEVVCYKGSFVSYQIAKRLIKIKYISLVNLIMDRQVVTELIQSELNENRIVVELSKIIEGGAARTQMLNDFNELRLLLGGTGASARVAKLVMDTIRQ